MLPHKMKSKRTPLKPEEFCPVRQTIRLLGKRWTILIIKEIYYGQSRRLSFMDLRKRLKDVSAKVLSERLKEMTDDGLVNRKIHAETKPVRVYYTLTHKGRDVCDIVDEMRRYGLKWGGRKTFDCKNIDCELCAKIRAGEAKPSP